MLIPVGKLGMRVAMLLTVAVSRCSAGVLTLSLIAQHDVIGRGWQGSRDGSRRPVPKLEPVAVD